MFSSGVVLLEKNQIKHRNLLNFCLKKFDQMNIAILSVIGGAEGQSSDQSQTNFVKKICGSMLIVPLHLLLNQETLLSQNFTPF